MRNNYIQYGHPDGKQSLSIGIALPKFIVEEGNGKYVVLLYTMLLGVLLPYLVGSWWYGAKRRSKEGVLMESANDLFRHYEDPIDAAGIIHALSNGKEYEQLLKGDKADAGLSKIESRIIAAAAEGSSEFACGFSVKDKEALEDLDCGARRKALALLWAYLGRIDLDDANLTKAKFEAAPIARALRDSFATISLAFGNIKPILASFEVNQHLIQAVAPSASPLLQLPHFTPAIAAAAEGGSRSHMTVQQFMDQPDAARRAKAVGKGLLTEEQYKVAMSVGKQLPYLRVDKAFFKVTGERIIIPSSLVSLVIKGRFIPPGTENVPKVNELDLEDVDAAEDDLEAITGRKKTIKGPDGKPISVDEKKVLPPLTHAPYYARPQAPRWHAFLSDSKQGKMAVPPFTFTHFDQPVLDDEGKPTFAMQTLKAMFAAPPQAGHYTFVLHVVCDSYVGFDTRMDVTMVVEEASKAAEMAAEDEISEPEEGKSFSIWPCCPFFIHANTDVPRLHCRPDARPQDRPGSPLETAAQGRRLVGRGERHGRRGGRRHERDQHGHRGRVVSGQARQGVGSFVFFVWQLGIVIVIIHSSRKDTHGRSSTGSWYTYADMTRTDLRAVKQKRARC